MTLAAQMSPAEGWSGVLLSGLIGAVVGGLVTVSALWLTLRHNRRLAEDERTDDAVMRLWGTTSRVISMIALHEEFTKELWADLDLAIVDVDDVATEVRARTHKRHPKYATLVDQLGRTVTQDAKRVLASLPDKRRGQAHNALRLSMWMMYAAARDFIEDSDQFDHRGAVDIATLRERAEGEISAADDLAHTDPPDTGKPKPA